MSTFLPAVAIRNKRDGLALSEQELRAFIAGASDGSLPDYQLAALLMAIYFRGLSDQELSVWADAMLHSGDIIDLSMITQPKIDKHSTGGIGDKISLPLAPALAACGVAVPMISGRGLGHTGGTLDKLQSIPGFRVDLSVAEFTRQIAEIGCCLIGQTDRIVPADRRLYALRDVTATVESIPLIASSIMSKKLAEGIDGLVLDCKVGDGAFMSDIDSAKALAQAMLAIGQRAGIRVTAVLTDMNAPIGKTIGNSLEVKESIEVLLGKGPDDTREITIALGGEMLELAGLAQGDAAKRRIEEVLQNGQAWQVFRKIVAAQGGDVSVVDHPETLPKAKQIFEVKSPAGGYVTHLRSRNIGVAAILLGAGRIKKEDLVDHATGVELLVQVGYPVEKGQAIARLHYNQTGLETLNQAVGLVLGCFDFGPIAPVVKSRILTVLR